MFSSHIFHISVVHVPYFGHVQLEHSSHTGIDIRVLVKCHAFSQQCSILQYYRLLYKSVSCIYLSVFFISHNYKSHITSFTPVRKIVLFCFMNHNLKECNWEV